MQVYVVMVCLGMAYIGMAYMVMAYIVMAYMAGLQRMSVCMSIHNYMHTPHVHTQAGWASLGTRDAARVPLY